MKCALVAVVGVIVAIGTPANSGDSSYIGTWKISGAVTAPWADPTQKPAGAEQARLIGKTIAFKAREIDGPPPFACKAPHYKESDFTADMIFQGAFGEMQSKDKSVDPTGSPRHLASWQRISGRLKPDARWISISSMRPPRKSASTTRSIH